MSLTSPLEALLPAPHVLVEHQRAIAAPPARVADAMRSFTLQEMPIARALFAIRGLGKVGGGGSTPLLAQMTSNGFEVLHDEPLAFAAGAIGRPWRYRAPLVTAGSPDAFAAFDRPGYAKMAFAFVIEPSDTGTVVHEQTRVICTDAASRRAFGRYWRVVRHGSSIVRRQMLTAIERRASHRTAGAGDRA